LYPSSSVDGLMWNAFSVASFYTCTLAVSKFHKLKEDV